MKSSVSWPTVRDIMRDWLWVSNDKENCFTQRFTAIHQYREVTDTLITP